MNKDHISEIFSEFGEIIDINFPINFKTGLNVGLCFLEYRTHEEAELAVESMNEVISILFHYMLFYAIILYLGFY